MWNVSAVVSKEVLAISSFRKFSLGIRSNVCLSKKGRDAMNVINDFVSEGKDNIYGFI